MLLVYGPRLFFWTGLEVRLSPHGADIDIATDHRHTYPEILDHSSNDTSLSDDETLQIGNPHRINEQLVAWLSSESDQANARLQKLGDVGAVLILILAVPSWLFCVWSSDIVTFLMRFNATIANV